MTFRDTMRSYLGWCPGFNRLYPHLPEKVRINYKLVMASTAILLAGIYGISALYYQPPPAMINGKLQIYITSGKTRIAYGDDEFTQGFDYSLFQYDGNGSPYFREDLDPLEFAKGGTTVTDYEFGSLKDLSVFLAELKTPNCLKQYLQYILAQSYEETIPKLYTSPKSQGTAVKLGYATTMLGDFVPYSSVYGLRYYIMRGRIENVDANLVSGAAGFQTVLDGVVVEKYNSRDYVWTLIIEGAGVNKRDLYPSFDQVFKVRMIRFAADNHMKEKTNP